MPLEIDLNMPIEIDLNIPFNDFEVVENTITTDSEINENIEEGTTIVEANAISENWEAEMSNEEGTAIFANWETEMMSGEGNSISEGEHESYDEVVEEEEIETTSTEGIVMVFILITLSFIHTPFYSYS
jgi:hypothetical protein